MTAQQKSGLHAMISSFSSIGAFLGSVYIIIQIGEFKGQMEARVASHEQRLSKDESDIVQVNTRLDYHIAADLQRQSFAKTMKTGE